MRRGLILAAVLVLAGGCFFVPPPARTPAPVMVIRTISPTAGVTATPALTFTPESTPALTCTVANTGGEYLRLRAGPNLSANVLAGLQPGQRLLLLDPPGGAWLRVQAGNHAGWVFSEYCEVTK